jgi:hypothetical protein
VPRVSGEIGEEVVEQFIRDGAIRIDAAVPREVADECRSILWAATGCDEQDPSTWKRPVVRLDGHLDPPFRAAANTPPLHAAFDRLAGVGRWAPRADLGHFPIRFPVPEPPGDDGWHIESTGADGSGAAVVDPSSQERVLLMLFLLSDVGPDDAPTRLRLGSHFDAARLLYSAPQPLDFLAASRKLAGTTDQRPEIAATGAAGDVWLCHPFVVHAAQAHRGTRVKFMAQPPLPGTEPIDPKRPAAERSPVEEAVHRALAS